MKLEKTIYSITIAGMAALTAFAGPPSALAADAATPPSGNPTATQPAPGTAPPASTPGGAAAPATPAPPANPPAPGVVAVVNGQNITRDQLVDFLLKRYGSSALDQLVDQQVLEQAAAKQGVTVTPQDLDLEYQAYRLSAPTPQIFDDYEKRVGKATIMENLRPRVIYEKIGEKLVTINPSDLDEVRASHILIKPEPATDEAGRAKADAAAKAKAEEVLAEVKKPGADFAALAKKYSQDPGSAARGGDLDFFGKGQMVPPFEAAAFAAKVGDIVGPIKSDFGYHIIKVTDRRDASKLSPAELQSKRSQLILRTANEPIRQWIDRQKKDAQVAKFPQEMTASAK